MASHLSWLSKSTGLSSLCHTASCHLSDILVCKVKWALGSITTNKASGGDGTPVELFHILKDDDVLHLICQQIWKTQKWPRTGKGQLSFQSPKKAMSKNFRTTVPLHTYHMLASGPIQFSSVRFSRSVMSDSLRPHESQHVRPPCPSATPRVHSNSRLSSR